MTWEAAVCRTPIHLGEVIVPYKTRYKVEEFRRGVETLNESVLQTGEKKTPHGPERWKRTSRRKAQRKERPDEDQRQ